MDIKNNIDYLDELSDKYKVKSDFYFVEGTALDLSVRNKEVESLKNSNEKGYSIRVFKDNKVGFAYNNKIEKQDIEETFLQALETAEVVAADQDQLLNQDVKKYTGELFLFDPKIEKVTLNDKIKLLMDLESIAYSQDKRIVKTEDIDYSEGIFNIYYKNSFSDLASYKSSYCGISSMIIAEENGLAEAGSAYEYKIRYDDLSIEDIAKESAYNAYSMLGAQGIKSGNYPVIFNEECAINILSILASMLSAEEVVKQKSPLINKLNSAVLGKNISIVDDATLYAGLNSFPFDGEGVEAEKTILVQNGQLLSYLTDLKNSKKLNIKPTGNGIRDSFTSLPSIKPTNLYIEPGSTSKEELFSKLNSGIYITNLMGMHMANSITGEFSVGASGYLVENGKIVRPVKGLAVAGNVLELFKTVSDVGDKLKFMPYGGNLGAPLLLIEKLSISSN